MRTISFFGVKGGLGKSTLTTNVAVGLVRRGKKVLVIDSDFQGNTTFNLSVEDKKKTFFDVLNQEPIQEAIIHTQTGVDLIPSDDKILLVDDVFNQKNDIYRLKKQLLLLDYDFILIDNSPLLTMATKNSLVASDEIIIPMTCESYSMLGLEKTLQIVKAIQDKQSEMKLARIKVGGVVFNKVQEDSFNSTLQNQIKRECGRIGVKVYNSQIKLSRAISRTNYTQTNVFDYTTRNSLVKAFNELIDEILQEQ